MLSFYITLFVNSTFDGIKYMGGQKEISIQYHSIPVLLFLFCLTFGKFASDAITSQSKMQSLENKKLESELQSLKSQINPHFLFNSLNAIYGLARRSNNNTPMAVLQLSDILRYVLYECDEEKIKLNNEINFLRHYIDFARLRVHNSDNIRLNVSIDKNYEFTIAPLIFLPFIENAIKHGLEIDSSTQINISLSTVKNTLIFSCKNNYAHELKNTKENGGIGLKNVKRRLNLIYPGCHDLQIYKDEKDFYVNLEIVLE